MISNVAKLDVSSAARNVHCPNTIVTRTTLRSFCTYTTKVEEHRAFFDKAGTELGIKDPEDWYNFPVDVLKKRGGAFIATEYSNSLPRALAAAYPHVDWLPWKFSPLPRGLWDDLAIQREYLDWLMSQLQMPDMEAWYSVSVDELQSKGNTTWVTSLLNRYKGSLHTALATVYPEMSFDLWKFRTVPVGFWNDVHNQKKYLEWLKKRLRINKVEEWHQITEDEVQQHFGSGLLAQYGSLIKAIRAVFTDQEVQLTLPHTFWSDRQKRRDYLNSLSSRINVVAMEDWYKIKMSDLVKRGCSGLNTAYEGSLYHMLSDTYPDVYWKPYLFEELSPSFWNDLSNHKRFLNSVEKELHISTPSDWYNVDPRSIVQIGAGALLKYYNDSLLKLLETIYSDVSWIPWKFKYSQVPSGFWEDMSNQRKFFDALAVELKIQHPSEWTKVKSSDILWRGGDVLLQRFYSGSLTKALSAVYPDLKLISSTAVEPVIKALRQQFVQLEAVFSVRTPEDWLRVRIVDLENHGCSAALKPYDGSLLRALSAAYPEQNHYWEDILVQRSFMSKVAQKLGVLKPEDWYRVNIVDIQELASSILSHYNNSLLRALSTLYPDVRWNSTAFSHRGWSSIKNQRDFFDNLAKGLNIQRAEDWYQLRVQDVIAAKGSGPLQQHGGSLIKALAAVYPEHSWRRPRHIFSRYSPSKAQVLLYKKLKELFPAEVVLLNYKARNLFFQNTHRPIEFDIYIPKRTLAFEYQGVQHYTPKHSIYGSSIQQQRDAEKKLQCQEHGITLICIPYWWNGATESLVATIRSKRPDISLGTVTAGLPIPEEMPDSMKH